MEKANDFPWNRLKIFKSLVFINEFEFISNSRQGGQGRFEKYKPGQENFSIGYKGIRRSPFLGLKRIPRKKAIKING